MFLDDIGRSVRTLFVLIFIDYSEEWIARRALVLLNTPLVPGLVVAHMLCRDVALLVIKLALGYYTNPIPYANHKEFYYQITSKKS